MKKNALLAYLGFLILMIALGASDAMRGVFVPIFGEHFALSNTQRSLIITVSYVGNLVFLLFGGRLAFAPLVQKLGVKRSILLFGLVGTVLFGIGSLLQENGLIVLALSGLFFSILYPTMVMMVQLYYPANGVATAAGMIISVATLFDIGWNALYGVLMDTIGMRTAYLLPAAAMALCFLSCVGLLGLKTLWRGKE